MPTYFRHHLQPENGTKQFTNLLFYHSTGVRAPSNRVVAQAAVHYAAGQVAYRLVTQMYDTVTHFRHSVIKSVLGFLPPNIPDREDAVATLQEFIMFKLLERTPGTANKISRQISDGLSTCRRQDVVRRRTPFSNASLGGL